MISQHRTRAGLAAAVAVASLAAAAPAGADPNPAQRVQSSQHRAALAQEQEQYYMSHKPAIPATGHDFRTIDARVPARAIETALAQEKYYASYPSAVSTPEQSTRTIDVPPSAHGFEWGDAAIGAGSALGLVLAFAGGAAAITRRHRPVAS